MRKHQLSDRMYDEFNEMCAKILMNFVKKHEIIFFINTKLKVKKLFGSMFSSINIFYLKKIH